MHNKPANNPSMAEAKANAQKGAESTPSLRWLHLSDFHVGKDQYGQIQLFGYLLKHIKDRVNAGLGPDLVFITGDIANNGYPEQYDDFNNEFLLKLVDCLPPESYERIFLVPGNHDVDRNQARAFQPYDVLLRVPEFLDPTDRGRFERNIGFSRFNAFAKGDATSITPTSNHWLFSQAGSFGRVIEIQGFRIAVLALNTAWLSCSDNDRHKMSMGKGLLEIALERAGECDLYVVLGHHPLDWLLDPEAEAVRAILGRHNPLCQDRVGHSRL